METPNKALGPYTKELEFSRAGIRPKFFSASLIEFLRRNPEYSVLPDRIYGQSSYIQQYVQARGSNGEPAIMILLAHLSTLSAEDQGRFKNFEIKAGAVDPDAAQAILFGEWPSSDVFHCSLSAVLTEINSLCGTQKLFDVDSEAALGELRLLLPIPQNSKDAFEDSACEMYKILVDGMRTTFFDSHSIPRIDPETQKEIGQIRRLRLFLKKLGAGVEDIQGITAPLEAMRRIRSPRSHTPIGPDSCDRDYQSDQNALFLQAIDSLRLLCLVLGRGLKTPDWELPPRLRRRVRPLHVRMT